MVLVEWSDCIFFLQLNYKAGYTQGIENIFFSEPG